MRDHLFEEGLSPEINSAEEFLALAKAYESAKKTADYYDQPTRVPRPRYTSTTPKPTQERYTSALHKTQEKRNDHKPGANRPSQPQVPYRKNKMDTKSPYKPAVKNDRPRQDKPGIQAPARKNGDGSQECFKCGQLGHWSRECKNPTNAKRAHVRAMHTAVPGEEGHADDEGDTSANEADVEQEDEARPESELEDNDVVEVEVYDYDESESEHMHAISEAPPLKDKAGERADAHLRMRKVTLLAGKEKMQRPVYPAEAKECLATYTNVGGEEAWTLWDTGSTTTGMTPAFAQVSKIKVYPLESPVVLQLGTTGSRASVNYGAEVNLSVQGFQGQVYMDLANFDRYDVHACQQRCTGLQKLSSNSQRRRNTRSARRVGRYGWEAATLPINRQA